MRVDSGEHGGFSAYVSGQYSQQDLFVNQRAYNKSTGTQFNTKLMYQTEGVRLTAFADISRTNQADDAYLSKEMLGRLGWDWGGYAPDWQSYLGVAYCSVTGPAAPAGLCKAAPAPQKNADVTFTNGQILRNDELYYLNGDFDLTSALGAHVKVYHHSDKGAGNNWIVGWSKQGTASVADDVPVQIRDTRYTIDRTGVLGSLSWDVAFNHLEAGFWYEDNTSSAARYIWTNVTGPFDLAQYLTGQPDTAGHRPVGPGDQVEDASVLRAGHGEAARGHADLRFRLQGHLFEVGGPGPERHFRDAAAGLQPVRHRHADRQGLFPAGSGRALAGRASPRAVRQLCREHGHVSGRLQAGAAVGLAGRLGRAGQDPEARDVEERRRRLSLCERRAAGFADRLLCEIRQPPAAI